MKKNAGTRDFLDLSEVPAAELKAILAEARRIKAERRGVRRGEGPLAGKVLAMIFEQPSTRTRISFDVGIRELGGEPLMLTGHEMQLGRGESIPDTARVLSRFVDMIMIRILSHEDLLELAEYASVPVINGLTKNSHPCQIMADLMTYEEHKGSIAGRRIAWVGDSNNVLHSWMEAAERFDFELRVATPPELAPDMAAVDKIRSAGANIVLTNAAEEAVEDADCIITDCWVSMGDEEEQYRHNLLKSFQVNSALMAKAKSDAIFMHCLPAHRGEEVTSEVMDGPQSVVFDEAENRLHAQKGVMAWCMGAMAQS
ncbi:ornithine carbamoyltransferase [Breoghania sp.]|uniref:ornithine carbamoyltransferase n=1 Tax=Breoghania sp. TaxID=2065378 RepID=UPI002AA7FD65|nr:ornithine carbamoyltransferase [Breoghania sp.]